ncbi:MAG: hypothetical protein ACYTFG_12590 [Planctomycetota bacterium]
MSSEDDTIDPDAVGHRGVTARLRAARSLHADLSLETKMLHHLGVAFELGFREFALLRRNPSLSSFLKRPAFRTLIEKYKGE